MEKASLETAPHARTAPSIAPAPHATQTLERVLAAAERCFAHAGYAGTSMREIATTAGVSKSLLHHHFESKEQLFVEVQLRVHVRLADRVTTAVSALPAGAARGLEALALFLSALRDTHDLALHAEVLARALGNAQLRVHMNRLRAELKALLRDTIARLLGDDTKGMLLDLDTTTDVLWAALSGLALQAALGESADRIEKTLAGIRRIGALALGTHGKDGDP